MKDIGFLVGYTVPWSGHIIVETATFEKVSNLPFTEISLNDWLCNARIRWLKDNIITGPLPKEWSAMNDMYEM
jgi:hypothetical protein